jgi:hypothetical protein
MWLGSCFGFAWILLGLVIGFVLFYVVTGYCMYKKKPHFHEAFFDCSIGSKQMLSAYKVGWLVGWLVLF